VRAALILAALLAGCASPRPDFTALYDFKTAAVPPPLIVIPGILGSRLYSTRQHEEIWPGSAWHLLFDRKERLALEIDPQTLEPIPDGVEPRGLFDAALGIDFYGEILRTLENYGRYERATPGQPADRARRNYYVFAYDWRQDNVRTAARLDALIAQIRKDYGDPTIKVDILAHSMGGLVARYYARYGVDDVLDGNEFHATMAGGRNINTLILLGTPNLGSAGSLHGFIAGATVGLRRIATEVLATTPSFYELFPHPLSDWLVTVEGKPLDRDLFDVETWRRFQWSVFDPQAEARVRERARDRGQDGDAAVHTLHRYFEKRLERARRFVWSLTVPVPPDAKSRMVVLGGDCSPTPARLLVEEDGGDSVVRLFPHDIKHKVAGVDYSRLMLEPGDGEVTKPSLLARESLDPSKPRHRYIHVAMEYSFFLCEEHNRLTGNATFQDNLLNLLLSGDLPWEEPIVPTSPKMPP
jgi:pimeloyl-ACP methyl ester carboxylesterase